MSTTDLTTLKINYLTQEQYLEALSEGLINENELYMTPSNLPANITISETDIGVGSPLASGDIYLVYE